jgi:hypothetical protein
MRYTVKLKTTDEGAEQPTYTVRFETIKPAPFAWCILAVEQADFDALSVGQEITVDVVPVPKEEK